MSAIANFLVMDRTTLTAALKPLVRRGLVAVAPNPKDRRSRRLTLTAEGSSLLAQAVPIWELMHRHIEAQLTEVDPDRLRRALRALA
jgi:DNA-binding MarR family transcriptional regulator